MHIFFVHLADLLNFLIDRTCPVTLRLAGIHVNFLPTAITVSPPPPPKKTKNIYIHKRFIKLCLRGPSDPLLFQSPTISHRQQVKTSNLFCAIICKVRAPCRLNRLKVINCAKALQVLHLLLLSHENCVPNTSR